jgi:ribose 5-phosphate isomerase A
MSSAPKLQESMRSIAQLAAAEVPNDCVLGLGSGSAVAAFARALGDRIGSGKAKSVSVVPSSMQAYLLARENGLGLHPDSAHCPAEIDMAVDGADQVSSSSRAMIKGGGGALLREKVILTSSSRSFILVDSSKIVGKLSRSVPVEVLPFSLNTVCNSLKRETGGDPALRRLEKGYPYFTESGNVVLDLQMKEPIEDPRDLELRVKSMPGVIEAGVFNCKVERFYVARPDGSTDSI